MSSVLGVSVGAGAVRLARPHAANPHQPIHPQGFDLHTIAVRDHRGEELAAEAVGVTLETTPDIRATAIAYRGEQQARAVRAAMARQQLTDYELVPELFATLEYAMAAGEIRGINCLVVYDLGSSGLTVSVVDTHTREVRYTERTSEISGDYLDSLIREQQIASGRIAHPQHPVGLAALDALCREAKEQLSSNTAVALPSEQGLVLLAQENFEALIVTAVESSARMTRDVVARAQRPVQGVLAIGGCARIPLVAKVLEHWIGVPVIVPENPETVTVRGAALLARPIARPAVAPAAAPAPTQQQPFDDEELSPAWLSAPPKKSRRKRKNDLADDDWLGSDEQGEDWGAAPAPQARRQNYDDLPDALAGRPRRKRELNGAVLTVTALVVIAAIGIGLGYGQQVLTRDSNSSEGTTPASTSSVPRTTTLEPQIAVAPATTTTETESAVAPPPRRTTTTPPPPTPGPNTFTVPFLPPIVVPTIPPELFPGPPPAG
ncbi:Hsp70 family protein [Nocardia sp. NPDC050712]|uniref:Hsp70 family protein n=1 Tax=Nocardia sp. NPDC050712 TaxID=3155518 RepID=UPI0034098E00